VHWVASKAHPLDPAIASVPLICFPAGCRYRARAIHAIERAGRAWHMAYTSSSLAGIQAAAGSGLSILPEIAIQADHRVLTARDGFAPIDKTEVALVASPDASPATLRLADRLAEFCNTVQAKAAQAFLRYRPSAEQLLASAIQEEWRHRHFLRVTRPLRRLRAGQKRFSVDDVNI
jgi:LysR substrate binding domain